MIGTPVKIEVKASESFNETIMDKAQQLKAFCIDDDIYTIIDAVHAAYIESIKELAIF